MSSDLSAMASPRLVLDTNVVMDLFHFHTPQLAQLTQWVSQQPARCIANAATLNELERVTGYPQFRLNGEARHHLLQSYMHHVDILPIPTASPSIYPPLPQCRDPDDQMFLELAQTGHAHLLISRDKLVLKLARARRHPCPFAILSPEAAQSLLCGTLS